MGLKEISLVFLFFLDQHQAQTLPISLFFITLVKPLLEIRLLLPVMAVPASILEVGFSGRLDRGLESQAWD